MTLSESVDPGGQPQAPLPLNIAPPQRSPRIGTHHAHSNPAVQAYHQNLSSHLQSLLQSTPSGAHTTTALKPPALIETGRKTSDESLSVTDRSFLGSGSGSTNLDSTRGITTLTGTVSSEAVKAQEGDGLGSNIGLGITDGEEGEEAEEELEDDVDDDGLPQLTARPELQPRRSLMHVPPAVEISMPEDRTAVPHSREVSGDSREDELQQAWHAEGKKVWRTIPDGFTLKMEREDGVALGSEASSHRRSGRGQPRAEGVGLGIGISSESDVEREMAGLSMNRTASRATSNSNITGGSSFSRSPLLPSSVVDTAAATLASTHPLSSRQTSRSTSRHDRPLRDPAHIDEKEEYEAKRLARSERKKGELDSKIRRWVDDVRASDANEENEEIFLCEILPTPPSPKALGSGSKTDGTALPFAYPSLPFTAKSHTFSTKQQPMFFVPPTPDEKDRSCMFDPNTAFPTRTKSFSGGVDLSAKLRALEDLMGPSPMPPAPPAHPELTFLNDSAQLGDGTIKARRRSSGLAAGLGELAEMETPRPDSGRRYL